MGKYLKKFENHTDYETYISGQDAILPNVSYCEDNNCVHYNPYVHDYADDYLTFVAKESGTFTFTPKNSNVISYSTNNGTTWTEGNTVSVNNGEKVIWKGTMTPTEYDGIGTFSSTANFDAQGNVMSLLYGDNFKGQTDLTGKNRAFNSLFSGNTKVVNAENLSLPATTLANCCYSGIFNGCTSLTSVPELPATTLMEWCYSEMFQGCTSLTTAPELTATTLANYCYQNMFNGCTSLTTAPVLPATTLAQGCYTHMFQGCTSLTTAPELPATTLAQGCYADMFRDCSALTTAPVLSAETLANNCYEYMFYRCTSLVNSPELPATTLANSCYSSMFRGCTSLATAPVLPAETLISNCYRNMFNGCTSLNYIKAMFTTTPSGSSPNYYTQNWVNGVASTGRFIKNAAATWNVTDVHGVPNGWTIQTASE